ncbi:hypothetical protein KW791_03575 [Candidatus Parcubacteria bacterium]|nr:hypothetical protein [Candidatus Parcubacteria bacterium]
MVVSHSGATRAGFFIQNCDTLDPVLIMAEKKAWRLIFAEGLLANYLDGSPQWSFRRYSPGSHEFTKGQIIEGQFSEGIMVLLEVIEDVIIKPFKEITPAERKAWAVHYPVSHKEMMRMLRRYYHDLKDTDVAALHLTRFARINDRPVAGRALLQ